MGEAPQAPDRQTTAYPDHQDSTQVNRVSQSQEKILAAPGGPASFPSRFSASLQASRAPASQHGNPYASYQHPQSMHGLDMSAVGYALPGSSPSSVSTRGFSQQAPPQADGMAMQSPGMNFRPHQLQQYGSQAYPSNMGMPMPGARPQTHPSSIAPHYYYNSYSMPSSQIAMSRQEQPIAGYSVMPGMHFGSSEFISQPNHSASYLTTNKTSSACSVIFDHYPQVQLTDGACTGHPRPELVTQPTPSYPRGPPRKPRQSGHALWVGNLPPGTTIGALKDHFSREATNDIESLFLISKSNCAFVNYRTEAACAAAMVRFHDSRFQGVRLVCRLRRGAPTSGYSPTTPDTLTPESSNETDKSARKGVQRTSSGPVIVDGSASRSPKKEHQQDGVDGVDGVDGDDGVDGVDGLDKKVDQSQARVPEKYFVVKSLTLQDLEASVRNGVWATQSHNEVALNHAYETADNVYLVFSANKSGEYFGYARMASPIASEPTTSSSTKLQPKTKDLDSGPKSIPTPATQWAPKGRIVDDSARGTIFWEVDNTPEDSADEDGEGAVDGVATAGQQVHREEKEAGAQRQKQEWGKSFQVEWISTNRLPFYRTRGLRNPWNENREIKIARDGTEIEPSIGQRLVQMFHRPAHVPQGAVNMSPVAMHFPS
ncbi:hypothetical protein E4T50_13449 [Aureobasidium sp. EXF-12298]|nr:hypothetical protein E4T50_13449 [Aureobasidium sp. EXF-12298]